MSAVERSDEAPALQALGVSAGYGSGRRTPDVLHDIDLSVDPSRALGVVGESGSGKSTLARVLVGQLRGRSGQVLLAGTDVGPLRGQALRDIRRQIQLIPQDPYASLDPRMSIRQALQEAIEPQGRRHPGMRERVSELLRTVALDPGAADRRPHEFSGGQRQRIAIARALAVEPEVLIADEVTSSLDSSVQAEILNLLRSIQARTGVAMVFITHDLSVANYMCDEIAVMYLGRIVERGGRRLLSSPEHPYTRVLVDSIPRFGAMGEGTSRATVIIEEAADPAHPPSGCPFHPRCPQGPRFHPDRSVCVSTRPTLTVHGAEERVGEERATACHFPLLPPTTTPSRPGL